MKNKQATPNNLLKKLYAFTQNKSLAFKRIMPVHKHIFWALEHGDLQIAQKEVSIQKELAEYKSQNKLQMDEEMKFQCVSIHDIFLGKQSEKLKFNSKQRKILQRQQERNLSKQNLQQSLLQKELQYKQKVKQFQKQKDILEQKKRIQQLKKLQELKEQEEKAKIQKQKELERQREQKKKKLQEGLKQMQQKRRQRQDMVKELAIQHKRSQSMKALGHSVPKYIELQKEYLQRQRRKAEEAKQIQKQKRESMQTRIEQIKNHQKQYIQRLKEKFTANGMNKATSEMDINSGRAKSEFNAIKFKDEQQEQKFREKANRRKQFQTKLRNIPIHVDINKKKQKQIEIDKAINKQKYMLLAKRHLDDNQIYNEFKDFEVKIDPKMIGKNYLNQLRQVPKAPKSQRIGKQNSQQFLKNDPPKNVYINYLQELKTKSKSSRKSQPRLHQNDQLLKLVQRSKKILKKHNQQQQNIYMDKSRVSLKQSTLQKPSDLPTKVKQNQLKKQVTKSITQKIGEYERKVLKKVNDLKKISQYDDSLKHQNEIDDLFSKVLKAKIDTIDLT